MDTERTSLEHFKDIHKGEDIYVMGSGKTCDFLDPSFFDNKICIGINAAFKRYKPLYIVKKDFLDRDETFDYARDNNIPIFYSEKAMGSHHNTNPKAHMKPDEDSSKIKTIMFKHSPLLEHHTGDNEIKKIYENTFKNNNLMISRSTITSGIHLAFYMGAKNIILVGHDCCFIKKESNYEGYHDNKSMKPAWGGNNENSKKEYAKWVIQCAEISNRVKNILKEEYNVNLCSINPYASMRCALVNCTKER